jgi:hypothetical protein
MIVPRFAALFRCLSMPLLGGLAVHAGMAQSENFHPESGYSELAGPLSAQNLVNTEDWQDAWNMPKEGPSAGYVYRDSANLPPSTGGGVVIVPTDDSAHEIGRKLARSIPMKGNQAIYASFRLRVSDDKPQGVACVLFSGIGGLGAGLSEGQLIALARRRVDESMEGREIKGWVPMIFQGYEPNTTYFFVVKIEAGEDEWAADDAMQVWINPKEGATEDTASSQALVYNMDGPGNVAPPSGSITNVTLYVENFQGATVKFDDLRIGTSWESVTGPIAP